MIRPPVFNPLLLAVAARAWDQARAVGASPAQGLDWGAVGALRRVHHDPDRRWNHWGQPWSAAVRDRWTQAHAAWSNHGPARPERDPQRLAEVIGGLRDDDGVVTDLDRAWPAHAHTLLVPRSNDGTPWSAATLNAIITARHHGADVWVLGDHDEWALEDPAVAAVALRLGIGAWSQPPSNKAGWEAFQAQLLRTTDRIVSTSVWDQWAWPWASLVEQHLVAQLTGRSAPESLPGWPSRRGSEWAQARKKINERARASTEDQWDEVLIASVLAAQGHALFPGAPTLVTASLSGDRP